MGSASRRTTVIVLTALAAGVIALCLFVPSIPQPQAYHRFADQRTFFGVPNALNVLSNIPFIVIGVLGLLHVGGVSSAAPRGAKAALPPQPIAGGAEPFQGSALSERIPFTALFLGMVLVGFGSGAYHLAPSDQLLVWDRLPITMVFMALFAVVLDERLGPRVAVWAVGPLVLVGVASVMVWHVTGDLRTYAVVQVYSLLALMLLLLLRPPRFEWTPYVVAMIVAYVVSKLLEIADRPIFALGGLVSGHTLKHLVAAVASWAALRMVRERPPLGASLSSLRPPRRAAT